MKRSVFRVALLWFVFSFGCGLTGCGGGGGGSDSALVTSTETFQLKTAWTNYVTDTSSTPFTMSGIISGVPVSGSATATEGGLTVSTFEGVSCNKKVAVINGSLMGNSQIIPLNSTQTYYYDMNYNMLGSSSSDEYTVVIGTMALPQTAKVNDSGILYTETIYPTSDKLFSTGTYTVSYSLEPDTATTALLKLTITERNASGTVVSTEVETLRLTPTGTFTRLNQKFTSSTDNMMLSYGLSDITQVDSSAIALLYFNEGAGSTSTDSSLYKLQAAITGGATWVSGKSGYALSFDNGTASATVEPGREYLGASKVSVEAWLYPNSTCTATKPCLIVGDSFSWLLQLNGSTVEFWINYGAGYQWAKLVSSTAPIGTNAWHHVAATYNGNNATLYVDGLPDATVSGIYTVGNDPFHTSISIGGSTGCCGYMDYVSSFPGRIDNVRIFGRELSSSEIAANYYATK